MIWGRRKRKNRKRGRLWVGGINLWERRRLWIILDATRPEAKEEDDLNKAYVLDSGCKVEKVWELHADTSGCK